MKRKIVSMLFAILSLSLMAYSIFLIFWQKPTEAKLPNEPSSSLVASSSKDSSTSSSSSSQSLEIKEMSDEIKNRIKTAKESVEYRDGEEVLYADTSYGGQDSPSDDEKPIAEISIPKIGFSRSVYRGGGKSASEVAGEADFTRLYNAITWRDGEILGGNNFLIASHIWTGEGAKDYSNDWFSPLLKDVSGKMTTDVSNLALKQGDEILAKDLSNGWVFKFKISEIAVAPKSDVNGEIPDETRNFLSSRTDKPRITLQGCLMGEPKLLFVVGELVEISSQSATFEYK